MRYLSVTEIAKKWDISERSVRNYCAQGRVNGAFLTGKTWNIPENAEKPERTNKRKTEPITLLDILKEQKASKYSGGIYHKTQIELTYNSNHMEGSRLTHDQTRYIFETNTIGVEKEVLNVDDVEILQQSPSMQEKEREDFLERFESENTGTLLGFCVMGGIFAEGIDLIGERLVGAVIVGTGLPQVSYEREILKQFYDRKKENGFDYAYRFPGMNKVLQSAGRVIRTKEDRGVILLLDERFCLPDYTGLFPREWEEYVVCDRRGVGKVLEEFWGR